MKKITRDEIKTALELPNGPVELVNDTRIEPKSLCDEAVALFLEQGIGSALLVRLAKSRSMLIRMSGNPALLPAVREALSSDSAKLRRNAARLLSQLTVTEADAELLIEVLKNEQTRFVRPSVILAIGAVGGESARTFLGSYTPEPPADETEKKHYDDEVESLRLARAAVVRHERHQFLGLDKAYEIELTASDRLTEQLKDELEDMDIPTDDIRRSSLKVVTADYPALFEARCFREALFIIATGVTMTPRAIAHAAAPFMTTFMKATHDGGAPYRYRIELNGDIEERTEFKKAVRDLMDCAELINSPSDYEIELRIEAAYGSARLYLKLYTVKDSRFLYRIGSLPASMNPATAAAVLRLASEYLTVNARVIDPCCGSGTLLFERGLLSPCASLTGIDIAHKAIDAARKNANAAAEHHGIKLAKFVCNDILRFESHRPYDELICNLPFGNRVGDHSSCETLYDGLLKKLPLLVKKGGIAVLYTMEFTMLKRLIHENPGLEILKQERTEAGGLTPMIFILRVS